MSDGDTPEEAAANAIEAISDWIKECKNIGREVPKPYNFSDSMLAERNALIEKLREMVEQYENLDARIEGVSAEFLRQNCI